MFAALSGSRLRIPTGPLSRAERRQGGAAGCLELGAGLVQEREQLGEHLVKGWPATRQKASDPLGLTLIRSWAGQHAAPLLSLMGEGGPTCREVVSVRANGTGSTAT